MLQWTGGSKRKVYASRNSTQSRQRQYFEQKKKKQQQNQNDIAGCQASYDKEPRSLDVLNINNLATPSNHHNNAEGAVPQLDFTLSDVPPTDALNNVTSSSNINMNETGSQPRLVSSFGYQHVAEAVKSHDQSLGCKISPSINHSTRQQNQNLGLEYEISLVDLASYEGSRNKSTAQPAREPHVSFSVKGLGHIKMETPPHTPISIKRDLPLPPKAMRFTHKAKRSIPFDFTKALDSMNSINMKNERRSLDKIGKILDESDHVRRKKFDCYFPDSFKNHSADLYLEDEDMFYEPRSEKDLQSKRTRSGGNLADENSDRLWRIDQFDSKDHFPTSKNEHFDTVDYGFLDRYSPERRNSTRSSKRFGNTGIPSSHDLFSDHSLMDDDKGTDIFEWERHPPSKKISNSNNTFGPSAWPSDMADGSERRRSPISEESCSSAAAMKDRSSKKPSPSVKNEMNKDEFHMSLAELDIPNMDTHLNGMSLFNTPEKVGHKRVTDQKKPETGFWPEMVSGQPRTREPSCRLSLKEKFSIWGSPSSRPKDSPGVSTVMHEDKPSFMSTPGLNMYQTVESTHKRPAPKVHPVFDGPDNVIFQDDIHMQRPASDIFGDKIEISNTFCAKDLRSNTDMDTLFGPTEDKKDEDNCATLRNRNADIFPVKKAVSSVKQTFVRPSTCSQPSGTDSFRHGFSPGSSFWESEPNKFLEDSHVSNGIFQGELLGGALAIDHSDKNNGKIEASEKPDTKKFSKICQLSTDHRSYTNGNETCSDGLELSNYTEERKDQFAASKQIPANLSCLQKTSAELFQAHTLVRPGTRENLDDPGVDYKAPLHSSNKTHHVTDQSEINDMFQSPFVEEVGIEKKIITSVSPNNSDVQYQFMLEQRVLQRLCVQKIVVPTPMKEKLDKDNCFRTTEDGSHVLAKGV